MWTAWLQHRASKGFRADIVAMEVTRSDQVEAVAKQMAAERGGIDSLVNYAGIARSNVPAEETTDEHRLNVIDVNLNVVF